MIKPAPMFMMRSSTLRLSMSADITRSIVGHGGVRPLIEICHTGESVSQSAAPGCLKNLSAAPKVRKNLAKEGIVRVVINLLDCGILDGPLPQESAVGALRNLVSSVSMEELIALGVLPRLVHVLKLGSLGAQQAAASAICRICSSADMKKLVGEIGRIPLLIKMLEAKINRAREVAAQAICNLMSGAASRKARASTAQCSHLQRSPKSQSCPS